MSKHTDDAEKVRNFFTRRSWLCHNKRHAILSRDAYVSLKERDGIFWNDIEENTKEYLLGFVDGWTRAKS